MKIEQLFENLVEAPIGDYRFFDTGAKGEPIPDNRWNSTQTMTTADLRLLKKKDYEFKLREFFSKTEDKFNIYIINAEYDRKMNDVDYRVVENFVTYEQIKNLAPMLFDLKNKNNKTFEQVVGNPDNDAINIIYFGNKTSGYIPLTRWMIAHRLGHIIENSKPDGMKIKEYVWNIPHRVKDILGYHIDVGILWNDLGLNKSSRSNALINGEIIAESVAQYIKTGEVRFSRDFSKLNANDSIFASRMERLGGIETKAEELSALLTEAEQFLTSSIKASFRNAKGKWAIV